MQGGESGGSADVVFADACDLMPGLGAELFQALTVVKSGGVIFRHDYRSTVGATFFWNWVSDRLPVFHVAGTTLVCLCLDSEEVFLKAQGLLSDPMLGKPLCSLEFSSPQWSGFTRHFTCFTSSICLH